MEKSEIETIYSKYFHDVFLYIRALSENESLAEEITPVSASLPIWISL